MFPPWTYHLPTACSGRIPGLPARRHLPLLTHRHPRHRNRYRRRLGQLLACGSNSIQRSASNPTNSEDEVKNIFVQLIESGYFTTTKMTLILYNALSSPKDHILLSCYNYKILLQIQEPLTSHLTEKIN